MGWRLSQACSGRNKKPEKLIAVYVSSSNTQGKEDVGKFIDYVKGNASDYTVSKKEEDSYGNNICVKYVTKDGKEETVYEDISLKKENYESIYNKILSYKN